MPGYTRCKVTLRATFSCNKVVASVQISDSTPLFYFRNLSHNVACNSFRVWTPGQIQDCMKEGVSSRHEFPWGVRKQARPKRSENVDCEKRHLDHISSILLSHSGVAAPSTLPLYPPLPHGDIKALSVMSQRIPCPVL